MTLPEFVDSYLAHTIAIVALTQVWIIAAWRRWIKKGKIEFHPSANIEVGFSTFGSTISLPGAVRVVNKDIFISLMSIRVVRNSDNAEHYFNWRAFKATTFDSETLAHQNIELATPFIVPVSNPRPITVFFASENFTQLHANDAGLLQSAWLEFGARKHQEVGESFNEKFQDQSYVDSLFGEFLNDGNSVDFYTRLNTGFFWHQGSYTLELTISGADADDRRYSWRFEITEEDEARLRLNVVATMKELCHIKVNYGFVYKPYVADA